MPPIFHPVKNKEDDRLETGQFSAAVARYLLEVDATQGAVIALNAPWGSGKTTQLNFIKADLLSRSSSHRHIAIDFSPWIFSSRDDVVRRLILELAETLRLHGNRPCLTPVTHDQRDKLLDIAELLISYASSLDVIGSGTATLVGGSLRIVGRFLRHGDSFDQKRQRLLELLSSLDLKLVVFVDDLDRLAPNEASDLFRAIKAVTDFPKVIYVLSYDRAIVEQALKRHLRTDGRKYLEKIAPVTFDLPLARKSKIDEFFLSALSRIPMFGQHEESIGWHISDLYFSSIRDFLRTPRDINRLIAAVEVATSQVGHVTWLPDLLGLQALRVFVPSVYRSLDESREGLGRVHDGSTEDIGIKAAIENTASGNSSDKEIAHAASKLCKMLFPYLAKQISDDLAHFDTTRLNQMRRLASPRHIDVYFNLTPHQETLADQLLKAPSVGAADVNNAFELAKNQTKSGGMSGVPTLLADLFDGIDRERNPNLHDAVLRWALNESDSFILESDLDRGDFGSRDSNRIAERLLRKCLLALPQSERLSSIEAKWTQWKNVGVPFATFRGFIRVFPEWRSEKDTSQEVEGTIALSSEDCSSLVELVRKRMEVIPIGLTLFAGHFGISTLYALKDMRLADVAEKLVADSLATPDDFQNLVKSFTTATFVSGSFEKPSRRIWRFRSKQLGDFTDVSVLEVRLRSLAQQPDAPQRVKEGLTEHFKGSDID